MNINISNRSGCTEFKYSVDQWNKLKNLIDIGNSAGGAVGMLIEDGTIQTDDLYEILMFWVIYAEEYKYDKRDSLGASVAL